jgi:hypothetical protein
MKSNTHEVRRAVAQAMQKNNVTFEFSAKTAKARSGCGTITHVVIKGWKPNPDLAFRLFNDIKALAPSPVLILPEAF